MNSKLKTEGNPHREVVQEYKGKQYGRYPIETPFITLEDDLSEIVKTYALPHTKANDILCISAKVVSITKHLVVHKDDVKITPLAKLIVKFVKKWPNDIGYSSPRKMQVAINQAGTFRIIIALIAGTFLRLLGKHGYFYRIAGHQINAIDGFTPGSNKLFEDYAFLPPLNSDEICQELYDKFGTDCAILDGNNIENHVFGMNKELESRLMRADLKEILSGNPQGQNDDGPLTPMVIVREL